MLLRVKEKSLSINKHTVSPVLGSVFQSGKMFEWPECKVTVRMWMRGWWCRTHWPSLVQEEEEVHEVDHQKNHVPNHHIKVTPVQSCPCDEETTSCQGERHRCWEISGFRRTYRVFRLDSKILTLNSQFNTSVWFNIHS